MSLNMVASMSPVEQPKPRTITGLVVPWGKAGHTSGGPVTVGDGSVTVPADLGRVKLLRDHSNTAGFSPVGYALSAESTPDGLRMSFRVGETPDGDAALADVTEGIRDALSVELIDTKVSDGTLTAGTLTAVALVPIPAFEDARVEMLTASHTPDDSGDTMPHDNHDDNHGRDDDTAPTTDPEHDPENPDDDDDKDDDVTDTPATTPTGGAIDAARVPSGLKVNQKPALTFSQAVDTIAKMRTGEASADMTAALSDITRSANPNISGPAWLGEMWSGAEYTREIIPTMTHKPLTQMRGIGWRWVTRPEVDDYAGDKAEVPSGTVETEPVEVKANRLAAAHDIDRAYFDFNETQFLQSFFAARANDYAIKTDERAAAFIVESAKSGTSLAAEPDLLHAAARARLEVKRQVRVEPSAYLVNPSSMFGLFQITQLDNPAYLDLLGVKPERFIATDLVPEGEIIAYAKPAVTWFELPGSPIRVDAERIDHGGKDSGIFGYWATLLNDQRGILSVPFTENADLPTGGTGEGA